MGKHKIPLLKGDNIYLDPFKEEDITEDYINWLNDPEINRYLEVRFIPQTRETVLEYVRSFYEETEKYFWAIRLNTNGMMVGTAKLGSVNRLHNSGGVGMMTNNKINEGKPVASEALSLMLEFAFLELGLRRIIGENISLNHQSNFMLRRAGFVCEGVARQAYRVSDKRDEYIDGLHFAILKDEWEQRRK